MGFVQAIGSCFNQYANFSGRASRSEFWYFQLFVTLIIMCSAVLGPIGASIALIALFLPEVAVQARRLHDTDHSALWVFIQIIPACAIIPLLIWYCTKGTEGGNRFGPATLSAAAVPAGSSSAPVNSIIEKAEQLAKLKGLFDTGAVTEEEFDRMKADILASRG